SFEGTDQRADNQDRDALAEIALEWTEAAEGDQRPGEVDHRRHRAEANRIQSQTSDLFGKVLHCISSCMAARMATALPPLAAVAAPGPRRGGSWHALPASYWARPAHQGRGLRSRSGRAAAFRA